MRLVIYIGFTHFTSILAFCFEPMTSSSIAKSFAVLSQDTRCQANVDSIVRKLGAMFLSEEYLIKHMFHLAEQVINI